MISGILDPNLENCAGLELIVCMQPSQLCDQMIDGLLDLECKVYPAKSPEDALSKIQFYAFPIIILEENYSLEMMKFMAFLPMVIRKNIFYTLVGQSLETGNKMQSFVLSANLVVNTQDIPNLPGILSGAILDNNRFFRPLVHALDPSI